MGGQKDVAPIRDIQSAAEALELAGRARTAEPIQALRMKAVLSALTLNELLFRSNLAPQSRGSPSRSALHEATSYTVLCNYGTRLCSDAPFHLEQCTRREAADSYLYIPEESAPALL